MKQTTSAVTNITSTDTDAAVIRVVDVGKCYQIYDRPQDRLKQSIVPRFYRLAQLAGYSPQSPVYFREFWALRGVTFDIRRGESVGIIGRNGAGKSTLLQIVAGTMTPTTGAVHIRGRIAALLELGSGFNLEFTGRENVLLYASILGLSNDEIANRFDEIASFADIGNFIDQPAKTYSSGMLMRLAFAVQATIEPDVLIVDEALAVGDAKFQSKCFRRMDDLVERGTTILFVSHDINTIVRFCSRAIMLEGGAIVKDGAPRDVAVHYQRVLFGVEHSAQEKKIIGRSSPAPSKEGCTRPASGGKTESSQETTAISARYGTSDVSFGQVGLCDQENGETRILTSLQPYSFYCEVNARNDVNNLTVGMRLRTPKGFDVFAANTHDHGFSIAKLLAGESIRVSFKINANLGPGEYLATFGVRSLDKEQFFDRLIDVFSFTVICEAHVDTSCLANLNEDLQVTNAKSKVREIG